MAIEKRVKQKRLFIKTKGIRHLLVDYGEAYININTVSATMNFERHVRIKILKSVGMKYADVEVPLRMSGSAEEKVVNLKATTYAPENGKVVEIKTGKDAVFKEKLSKYTTLHKITLPKVKVGTVIEYSYTIISDFVRYFRTGNLSTV